MGCAGCGSGSIIPGSLTARKNRVKNSSPKRIKGYSGGGIIKSQKRRLREAGYGDVVKAMEEAASASEE